MENLSFDVLVIGAGAAGMIGALEIALTGRSVAVVEAKDRTGGRMLTIEQNGLPVELGAEFIHGNQSLTKMLLEKAGANIYGVKGSFWQHRAGQFLEQEDLVGEQEELKKKFKNLKADKSVARFLAEDLSETEYEATRFGLQNYVEGYYAADTTRASTHALCEELTKADEEQLRIEGGYYLLSNFLEKQCRENGVRFYLSQQVTQVHWRKGEVTAFTAAGSFKAKKAMITMSLGLLQKEAITFFPALPQVKIAVRKLGFGHVVKIVMQFENSFWRDASLTCRKDLSDAAFIFSEEAIPTWWTHYPKNDNILVGWLGGPQAAALQELDKDEVLAKALFSLSRIFNLDIVHMQRILLAADYHNWSADEHFCGAYSYEVVGGEEAILSLQQPVEATLFFAGEGLHHGPKIGTVEGALTSGREMAHRLIASFSS